MIALVESREKKKRMDTFTNFYMPSRPGRRGEGRDRRTMSNHQVGKRQRNLTNGIETALFQAQKSYKGTTNTALVSRIYRSDEAEEPKGPTG